MQRPARTIGGGVPEPDHRQADPGARVQRADRDRRDHEPQAHRGRRGRPNCGRLRDAPARDGDIPGLAAGPADNAGNRPQLQRSKQMTNGPAAIEARDLTATYGATPIWSNATFSIPEGSFTAVLGPNGSGKSTLIRLILGQLTPAAGSLEVLGQPPRRGNAQIGYIPQGSSFDPELSIRGRDFVGLGVDGHRGGGRLTGRAGAPTAANKSIEAVGADAYADRQLGRLSGGE